MWEAATRSDLSGGTTFKEPKVSFLPKSLKFVKLTLIFDIIGLIFVVDSNDRERVGEAAVELGKILQEDELQETKVLILCNKQGTDSPLSSKSLNSTLFQS